MTTPPTPQNGDPQAMLAQLEHLQSELHRVEQELAQAQRLAMLGTLAGSIAHEFNNLLTPIMSYAHLALASPDDPELVRKALQKAVDGSERASTIASSMLGFLRGGNEKLTHIGHAVRDTLACLARPLDRDGINLELDIPSDLWVPMNPVALEQVLLNLVINARAAIYPKAGTLRIEAEGSTWNIAGLPGEAPPTEPAIIVRVSDTGCGIDPEIIERIFDPFVRGPKRDTGEASSGLGLSICRRLIEEAGGRIDVESEVGKGTTFTLALPRAEAVAEPQAAA